MNDRSNVTTSNALNSAHLESTSNQNQVQDPTPKMRSVTNIHQDQPTIQAHSDSTIRTNNTGNNG